MAGLVSKIKNEVKKAGANKKKFVYVREGEKRRFRFLTDADDGMEITFHDNFEGGVVPTPCQEVFGRNCPYCDVEGIRTRSQYAWSVWDYDAKEVAVFLFPVNNCSPVPQLVNFYDTYGTICDRDYIISVSGKQQNKSYGVVPMDKVKFRNDKVKPFSSQQLLKLLDKAFPCDASDSEDELEDVPARKKSVKQQVSKKPQNDEWGDEDALPSTEELEEMNPQKLYNMCKERDIEVKPKRDAEYYIDKLEQWREDNEGDSDDDYDADQEWSEEEEQEEDAPNYEDLGVKELYNLCKDRGIEVPARKSVKFYIKQLEEYDKAQDEWGDTDSGDEWEDE